MEITPCHCLRCNHRWIPRLVDSVPKQCPRCHQSNWNVTKMPCPACHNRINKVKKDPNKSGYFTCARNHLFSVKLIGIKRYLVEIKDGREKETAKTEIPDSVIFPDA